jgi:hypothetical protein
MRSLMRDLRLIRAEWGKNYAHHGGIVAVWNALAGTRRVKRRDYADSTPRTVEVVTFSVVPGMTALWSWLISDAIPVEGLRVLIGDCTGGGVCDLVERSVIVIPMLNYLHGEKLDLFIQKVCTAEFIVFSDDDIFWLDDAPWQWAMEQFAHDPQLAVVSLYPREDVSSVLRGKVDVAMGSYCLIVRRDIWLRERLSFQMAQPEGKFDWFYDTADLANVQLIERGYHIAIAPPEIRAHLVTLEAISTWTLKIQKYQGDIREAVGDIVIRQEKALRAVLALRGLEKLYDDCRRFSADWRGFVRPGSLNRAEAICRETLSAEQIAKIEAEVRDALSRIGGALQRK